MRKRDARDTCFDLKRDASDTCKGPKNGTRETRVLIVSVRVIHRLNRGQKPAASGGLTASMCGAQADGVPGSGRLPLSLLASGLPTTEFSMM